MKNAVLSYTLAGVLAVTLLGRPGAAHADAGVPVNQIDVTYHGGALIQHPSVETLFWGKAWSGTPLHDYLNSFFKALFEDGRYMANLSQYSESGFQIGGGKLAATDTDEVQPPARVTDAQIQAEIRSQIAAGKLPQPEADILYVIITPPQVEVVDSLGKDSVNDFLGYHEFDPEGQFPYVVLPYEEISGDARLMTLVASHELSEAVTDPEPVLPERRQGGWYDEQYGEIGDIPAAMFSANQIGVHDFADVLTGADGTRYVVQKVWSVRDGAPVAFATDTGSGPATPGVLHPGSVVTIVTAGSQ